MDGIDLPPKPDARTGEPRPPEAPLRAGWSPGENERALDGVVLEPPPGQGPVLESFRPSKASMTMGLLVVLGIFFVVGTVKMGSLEWVSLWWAWLIIGLTVLLLVVGSRRKQLAAGADWLSVRGAWVRTYELTRIKATRAYATVAFEFVDSGGRHVYTKALDLQQNSRLWDLVNNGILHSVYVNRAEVNALARKSLELDDGRWL
ncbi:MAG: hypothetical protein ACRDYU_08140 [Actinomycetes bacterium]